ncbi:spherulation-specific family 4 protein [Arthrobacter sp. USHLN218]|uniref:spherulation-specific family 4 protein n=1 Tax=Arthrobacter sp. USHLN218 TaxID=3081232 RepID=UPI00301A6A05
MHPLEDPRAWQWLAAPDPVPGLVVVNVHNGPGRGHDIYYTEALRDVSRTNLLGYVDVDYGQRSKDVVAAEVREWIDRYAITGVMFDRVPTSESPLNLCRAYVLDARAAGATNVAGNPGTVPDAGYLDIFDQTIVFENTWSEYRRVEFPGWLGGIAADKIWHLVYGCRPEEVALAMERAGRLGVGYAFASTGNLPNPWRGLTGRLTTETPAG